MSAMRASNLRMRNRLFRPHIWDRSGKSWGSLTPRYGRLPPLHRSCRWVAKFSIPAPQDGAVTRLVAEPREAIVPGQSVMTLQARGQAWTGFNLPENQLDGLAIGFPVELIPTGDSIRFVSDYMQVV